VVPVVMTLRAESPDQHYSEPASLFAMQLIATWASELQRGALAKADTAYRAVARRNMPPLTGIRIRRDV
jgi:hypothetical protein